MSLFFEVHESDDESVSVSDESDAYEYGESAFLHAILHLEVKLKCWSDLFLQLIQAFFLTLAHLSNYLQGSYIPKSLIENYF